MMLFVVTNSYFSGVNDRTSLLSFTKMQLSPAVSASPDDGGNKKSGMSFDSDFAEAISKPLPQWYKEAKLERESLKREIEKNREKILKEFRDTYEVTQDKQQLEREKKWAMIQKRLEEKKLQKNSWLGKVQNLFRKEDSTNSDMDDEETVSEENWEQFLAEEEKQTGLVLPNFFDVFPELQFRWPKWAKRKDGSVIECDTDNDCPVPLSCCAHPIIPGPKFCCSGWGQRMLVKSYIPLEVTADYEPDRDDNVGRNGNGPYGFQQSSCRSSAPFVWGP